MPRGLTIAQDRALYISGRSLVQQRIPNSEANHKLIHRWILSEDTSPFEDYVGSADATNHGTSQVVGNWVNGAARQGNGEDSYIELSTLGGFGSSLGTTDGFAIAFSFRGERGLDGNGGTAILGTINSDGTAVQIPDPEDPRAIFIRGGNDESSYIDWSGAADYEDATSHRIVYNIPSVSDASTWEIFADQSQQSVSVGANRSPSNFTDFEHPLLLFARYSSGTPSEFVDVVLDDVCLFGNSLTESEVLSYQNPWE